MKLETPPIASWLHQGPLANLELRRILIVRALPGLGDLLCLIPALHTLRTALPNARICLVGLPWAREFVARFPHYLNALLEFPGYPGIPECEPDQQNFPFFLIQIHQQHFDLALQMHGNGTQINPFTVLLGARRTAGFYRPGDYCPDPHCFLPYPQEEPEIWRHLRLLEFLGFPLQGAELEFPLYPKDHQALHQIPGTDQLRPGNYVCIHPGAHDPFRRWSPEQFAIAGDYLASQGLKIVLTGTQQETVLIQTLIQMMQAPVLNLCGSTDLGTLGALISEARMILCNDTGISHLAAALKIPSVIIFSWTPAQESPPDRWAPLDHSLHHAIYPSLSPDALHQEIPATQVSIQTVISEIREILNHG